MQYSRGFNYSIWNCLITVFIASVEIPKQLALLPVISLDKNIGVRCFSEYIMSSEMKSSSPFVC